MDSNRAEIASAEHLPEVPCILADALNALQDNIAIVNNEGRILAVNRSWRRFAERNGPVVGNVHEGADYFKVCRDAQGDDAQTAQAFLKGIQAVLCGDRDEFALEYPCHSPDRQRWFRATVTAFARADRKLALVSHNDITQRKLAEDALARSEQLYRTIFQASGNAMLIFREDGTIVQVNPQFEEITGYPRHEVEGLLNWRNLIAAQDQPGMERLNQELWSRTDTAPVNAEIRFTSRQGQIRYALMAASRIVGTPNSIAFLTDFTIRRAMNQALLEGQSKLTRQHDELQRLFSQVEQIKKEWELTLDCLGDIVVLTDSNGCIKRCNRALKDFTGKKYGELIGRPLNEVLGSFEVSTQEFDYEGVEMCDLASGRHLIARTYPLRDISESETGTVLTLHDITRVKQITGDLAKANQDLEIKRRELQKAYDELAASQQRILQQEKMASIGQLAAGVAHEINNPIGFITSNLGTMEKYWRRLSEFLNDQAKALRPDSVLSDDMARKRKSLKIDYILSDVPNLLNESMEGADRVKKIVQDLKSFSRMDDGQPKPGDLVQCLDSTINIVWNELKYKAELVRDFSELPLVVCHAQQLNQVFLNLLVNAAHALKDRGTITVSTRRDDAWVYIAVRDTGCGIEPQNLGRLFDPFYTTKPVGEGTGLGLAIAYEIVKKHGGDIDVESTPGLGSTFTVRLPCRNGFEQAETITGEGNT
jgi:two-component system, NtrC family, sensor kinase